MSRPDEALPWQIWFDGSALPNPGRMGLGAVVLSPIGERIEVSVHAGASGCNNEAELRALCAALDVARAAGARHVLVRGDSDFAVAHLTGRDCTSVARLVFQLQAARERLAAFEHVELCWVPRHRNTEADALSRASLGLAAKPARVPGRAGRRRRT